MSFAPGVVYILLCESGYYYVGSTFNLKKRMEAHFSGIGANFTIKHPPVKLVYLESFIRIDLAFKREKQIQNWSRAKKEALINGNINELKKVAKCLNKSSHLNYFKTE